MPKPKLARDSDGIPDYVRKLVRYPIAIAMPDRCLASGQTHKIQVLFSLRSVGMAVLCFSSCHLLVLFEVKRGSAVHGNWRKTQGKSIFAEPANENGH